MCGRSGVPRRRPVPAPARARRGRGARRAFVCIGGGSCQSFRFSERVRVSGRVEQGFERNRDDIATAHTPSASVRDGRSNVQLELAELVGLERADLLSSSTSDSQIVLERLDPGGCCRRSVRRAGTSPRCDAVSMCRSTTSDWRRRRRCRENAAALGTNTGRRRLPAVEDERGERRRRPRHDRLRRAWRPDRESLLLREDTTSPRERRLRAASKPRSSLREDRESLPRIERGDGTRRNQLADAGPSLSRRPQPAAPAPGQPTVAMKSAPSPETSFAHQPHRCAEGRSYR